MLEKRIFLLTVFTAALLTGCLSFKPKPMETLSVSGKAENEACEVYAMSMTREMLQGRFGKSGNPFVAPPMLVTPRYFYVFSVTFHAKQAVTVKTDRIELMAEGRRENPDGEEAVIRFWQANTNDDNTRELKGLAEKERIIRRNLCPENLSLQAGESYTGYIMFVLPDPAMNPEKMIIPAESPLIISF